jgi:hypothetical protein
MSIFSSVEEMNILIEMLTLHDQYKMYSMFSNDRLHI